MAAFSDIRDIRKGQIRKALAGATLLAPESADPIAALTTGAGSELNTIPAGYDSLGRHPRDGAPTFTPESEQSEVLTWGELEASRIDQISKTTTITWTCQDTRKSVLAAHIGVDLSTIEPDPVTGEIQIIEPTDPDITYYRALFLMVDGSGDDAFYIARFCPRFVITAAGEESWNQENAITYPFTGRALVDDDLGYAVKRFYGGPAWKRGLTAGGWALPVTYTVTVTGTPTGGTFTLTVAGQTTAPIAFDAAASAVEAALEALSTVSTATVTGSAGGPYTVVVAGVLTGSGAGLTGGTTPSLTVVAA